MRRIFTVPDGIHSDAHPDYEAGRIDQLDADEREARILAFGAIRRAAEIARHHDQVSDRWRRNGVQDLSDQQWFAAACVRDAIRAAIGSDKV